jgi:hypothetical protein
VVSLEPPAEKPAKNTGSKISQGILRQHFHHIRYSAAKRDNQFEIRCFSF